MLDDKAQLEKGMQILGFENIPQIISKLLIYKELLIKWNNSFNLTSVKNTEIVTHHFLDCLAVIPFIKSSTTVRCWNRCRFTRNSHCHCKSRY